MMLRDRRYDSGSRYALWRWTDVALRASPRAEPETYLVRLHLFKTPWCSLMLHWFYGGDPQRDPHDHPVSFLSIVLRGWYIEERGERVCIPIGEPTSQGFQQVQQGLLMRQRVVRRLNLIRCTDVHRVTFAAAGTLTLCLAGPKRREWGFHTPLGWVGWRAYAGAGEVR